MIPILGNGSGQCIVATDVLFIYRLYADNCSFPISAVDSINRNLRSIFSESHRHFLFINSKKSSVMVFAGSASRRDVVSTAFQ